MSANPPETYKQGISNGKPLTMEIQQNFDTESNESPLRSSNPQQRLSFNPTTDSSSFPPEIEKTLLCFASMTTILVLNLLSTAIIHDRTPNDEMRYPPLRDISFDVSADMSENKFHSFFTTSEILLVISTVVVVGIVTLHKHKSIIFRRFFFMMFLLFTARLLTMNATMLPISSGGETLYQCESKQNPISMGPIMARFLKMVSGFGLSSTVELKYCGNYIFSGHTVILILNSLMTEEYCPFIVVNIAMKLITLTSIILLLISQYDYTVSVIIAYYITTRLFWLYHTLINNPALKKLNVANQICKEWWYPFFQFLEGNVKEVVPQTFEFFG